MAKKIDPNAPVEKVLPFHYFEEHAIYHSSLPVLKHFKTLGEYNTEFLPSVLKLPKLMALSKKALSYDDGCFKFDREDALASGVAFSDYEFLDASFQVANRLILNGSIKLNADLTITPLLYSFFKTTIIDVTINGERYVLESEMTIFGMRYYFSKALINKLVQLINAGATAAAVLAALQAGGFITAPSAAITGLIAALMAFGGAALQLMDFCNGVYILYPLCGIPPIVPYPA